MNFENWYFENFIMPEGAVLGKKFAEKAWNDGYQAGKESCRHSESVNEDIKELVKSMQFKLDKNKHKECASMNPDGKGRTYESCDISWLIYRLFMEVGELAESFENGNLENALLECADVANFAAFVHGNIRRAIETQFDKEK